MANFAVLHVVKDDQVRLGKYKLHIITNNQVIRKALFL
jgi:hypothetical protein